MADSDPVDLRFPIQQVDGDLATVPVGSPDEIVQCVKAIIRTPRGWRDAIPDLGLAGQLYRKGGPDVNEINRQLTTYEPRVESLVQQDPSRLNDAISLLGVRLQ